VRCRPARHAVFAARRVVCSVPENPIATRRSCTLSAQIFPFDVSTNPSTFDKNASINFGRVAVGAEERIPAAGVAQRHIPLHRLRITPRRLRRRMARRVRSYDSKISMISLSGQTWSRSLRLGRLQGQQPASNRPERSTSHSRDGDHLTAQQDFCCSRAGTQLVRQQGFQRPRAERSGRTGRPAVPAGRTPATPRAASLASSAAMTDSASATATAFFISGIAQRWAGPGGHTIGYRITDGWDQAWTHVCHITGDALCVISEVLGTQLPS
jgi:hypothetical protein